LMGDQSPYDLVLMDLNMPVMGGIEASTLLRQWERETGRARLPIIAWTADAFEEDRQACLDAGMDDFITKPIDIRVLHAAVRRWIV
ncbi:MAG: response regulator, partial [Rhodoferax sp.]